MNWKTCKKHGDENPNVWGCPECLRELRQENKILRSIIKIVLDERDTLKKKLLTAQMR